MTSWLTLAAENSIIAFVLCCVGVGIALYAARRSRALGAARYIAGDGQYELATNELIELATKDAIDQGHGHAFLTELADIRSRYGRMVKVGHLIWARKKAEGEVPADAVPPPFVKATR
jgi:hypothetical protein